MPKGCTFGEIWNQLPGLVSSISASFAREITNQARASLYSERDWGFLFAEGFLRIPTLINTSTVIVTQFSKDVIVTPAIKIILDAIELNINNVPIAWRQFRVIGSQRIYTIASYDSGNSKLVLEDIYLESTNAVATYEIFKCYITPPESFDVSGNAIVDFRRFHSIID